MRAPADASAADEAIALLALAGAGCHSKKLRRRLACVRAAAPASAPSAITEYGRVLYSTAQLALPSALFTQEARACVRVDVTSSLRESTSKGQLELRGCVYHLGYEAQR